MHLSIAPRVLRVDKEKNPERKAENVGSPCQNLAKGLVLANVIFLLRTFCCSYPELRKQNCQQGSDSGKTPQASSRMYNSEF